MSSKHKTKIDNNGDYPTKELIEKAFALFKKQDYPGAVKLCNKIIEAFPQDIDVWDLKGNSLLQLRKFDEAIACYIKIGEFSPESLDADLWNNIGNTLYELAEFVKAIECYDFALALDPQSAWVWRNKGLALQNCLMYEDAIKCYDQSINLSSSNAVVFIDKGTTFSELGKFDDAIGCYDKAIEIDPKFVMAWINKAIALNNLQKIEDALVCFHKAIEIDPNNVQVWNQKGNILFNTGRYNEAISCYDKVIELDTTDVYALMNKASALNRLEKTDEAKEIFQQTIKLLEKSLDIDPMDAELWVNKGNCLELLNDYNSAEECYKKALDINPKHIDALSGLGGIYADIRYDFVNSLEISHQLVMINPSDVACKMDYIEDLLKMGRNSEVREEGLALQSKASFNYHQCLIRFFIFSAWLFEGNREMSDKALADFFEYYQSLTEPFVITSTIWRFNGLTEYTKKSSVDLQSKFLELTLIDLLQGKIKRQELLFTVFFESFNHR